jgi:Fe-S cluster assembly protein SufD
MSSMSPPSAVSTYVTEAERLSARRTSDPAWLVQARRDGMERFRELGFPTTRDEEWRFTSVTPIVEGRFDVALDGASSVKRADLAPFDWAGQRAATLVFVNGHYAGALSDAGALPPGVRVESLERSVATGRPELEMHLNRLATGQRHVFSALNLAFLADGAFIHIAGAAIVEAPIHLLFLSVAGPRPAIACPRVLVVAGANSQATIVESYGAVGATTQYFTNAVTEIAAGENATVHHYKVQRESPTGFHVGAMYVRAGDDASVSCHSISLGGSIVRNEVVAVLDGAGARCTLNGLYLSDGTRLVDNHTTIDHARPHCGSREVYKGILADRGRAVFNGKIIVRPDAQKTDAKQTNKALLLSEAAQINTKPQLEIFANDVKCTHGAAVGQMDDDAIFYLRARGLDLPQARHMLIRAFAADVLNQMPLGPLRAHVDDDIVRRLPGGRG